MKKILTSGTFRRKLKLPSDLIWIKEITRLLIIAIKQRMRFNIYLIETVLNISSIIAYIHVTLDIIVSRYDSLSKLLPYFSIRILNTLILDNR